MLRCHLYVAPVVTPASTVKSAIAYSQITTSSGWSVISGSSLTVRNAGIEVTLDPQLLLTTAL